MSAIRLYNDGAMSVTAISNIFIDEYMPNANGEFVKVYLYLVRALTGESTASLSLSAIADVFDSYEKDVVRALGYWEKQGLLRLESGIDGSIAGVSLCNPKSYQSAPSPDFSAPQAASAQRVESVPAPRPVLDSAAESLVSTAPAKRNYSADEKDSFRKNPEVSELFFVIEAYLRKPLSDTSVNTVLFWYDSLGFSTELIDYLVEYCVNKGHCSFRYMDRIAMDWHARGIATIDEAREDSMNHNKANYAVMKAMGISGRDLAQSEKAIVSRWTNDWKFELPIIEEACRRTIEATHQPSFPYADKVLASWHEKQIRTMDEIRKTDAEFNQPHKAKPDSASSSKPRGNKFVNGFDARENNDYDQLEQLLVNTPVL